MSAAQRGRLAGATLDLVGPRVIPYRRLAAALAPPGAPLRTVPLAEAYRSAVRDPSYAYGTDDLNILVGGFTGDHQALRKAAGVGRFVDVLAACRAAAAPSGAGRRSGRPGAQGCRASAG